VLFSVLPLDKTSFCSVTSILQKTSCDMFLLTIATFLSVSAQVAGDSYGIVLNKTDHCIAEGRKQNAKDACGAFRKCCDAVCATTCVKTCYDTEPVQLGCAAINGKVVNSSSFYPMCSCDPTGKCRRAAKDCEDFNKCCQALCQSHQMCQMECFSYQRVACSSMNNSVVVDSMFATDSSYCLCTTGTMLDLDTGDSANGGKTTVLMITGLSQLPLLAIAVARMWY
jgi:hypothetical protein